MRLVSQPISIRLFSPKVLIFRCVVGSPLRSDTTTENMDKDMSCRPVKAFEPTSCLPISEIASIFSAASVRARASLLQLRAQRRDGGGGEGSPRGPWPGGCGGCAQRSTTTTRERVLYLQILAAPSQWSRGGRYSPAGSEHAPLLPLLFCPVRARSGGLRLLQLGLHDDRRRLNWSGAAQ